MPTYGTYRHGRLTYHTQSDARHVARKLGISGTHSHMDGDERVYMPGSDHETLNEALKRQGLPPVRQPGDRGGGLFDLGLGSSHSSSHDDRRGFY